MGMRYTLYRVKHEVEKRFGFLTKKFPSNPKVSFFISLKDWRQMPSPFWSKEQIDKNHNSFESEKLKSDFQNIISNSFCYFNYEWKNLGKSYDWITNPDNGYRYNINLHWSKIPDFSNESGDIKYVWEKSRFTYLLTVIRYDYVYKQDNSRFVFSEIESWIKANPINMGPNWRCSQEVSLRLINWLYALCFYRDSKYLTDELWNQIQNVIYWSLHHVYHHINFSRIAVRNNHAITETLTLALSSILFPFIPETKLWSRKGRKWFEAEIMYQIYEDGTFLQFSMNYHRVVIQLLSLGISVTERYKAPFSPEVYDKAYSSLNFLYQCLQEENGNLPNYGSNDGALFFPFSDSEYRDYRPQLNTLHKILTGQNLYEHSYQILEDGFWIIQNNEPSIFLKKKLVKRYGTLSFPVGGYYLLREADSFTFIRCGNHKDRPAHADNLHVDIWIKGQNILRDSGTYKYNTTKELQEYFTGSKSHNTVVVNNHSQMLKGSRFIWYYWSQSRYAEWKETETEYVFEGEISAFRYLNQKAAHKRTIIKEKGKNKWVVEDELINLNTKNNLQLWHHDKAPININAEENNNAITSEVITSYNSSYYGIINDGMGTGFRFNNKIVTYIDSKE